MHHEDEDNECIFAALAIQDVNSKRRDFFLISVHTVPNFILALFTFIWWDFHEYSSRLVKEQECSPTH